jgi:DNA invertase Pin-like site-specific DNA recombinase
MTSPLLDAREYLRVSFDKSGHERSNEEQHDDNARAFPDWRWGKPYRDVGSASRFATRRRDDFDILIADLEADRFRARHLVLWESSRGSRKVRDWVTLIDLCEQRRVLIAVTTHGRIYDPENPRDRRSLLEDAVDSEWDSAKTSMRVRRDTAANAAKGRPHGRIPYGYERRYVVHPNGKRELVAQVPHPVESALLIEAFERVAAGDSLKGVARDLAARGMVGRNKRPITPETLRPMLLNETYRGQRIHVPGSRSRTIVTSDLDEVTRIKAELWKALVSDELFYAVRNRLTDPKRKTARPGRGIHLLSMIAQCDACKGPLAVTFRDGHKQYQCHRGGHVRIDADPLDDLATTTLLRYLSDPANLRFAAEDDDGEALGAARDTLARVRAEHADLVAQVARGAISATLAAGAEPGILTRLRAAEAEVEELSTPSTLRGLLASDLIGRWDDPDPERRTPMSAKREIARTLFAPEHLGTLRITRSPSLGHKVPVEQRVIAIRGE